MFLNAIVLHCRLAVSTRLIVQGGGQVDQRNSALLALIQETESRSPNFFTNLIKSSKLAKDSVEAERRVQPPLFQAVLERKSLIRKSDGVEFGLAWHRNLFESLVIKISRLLMRIYRGSIWQPMAMSWSEESKGRQSLSPDPFAIALLSERWDIQNADADTASQFAGLVGE